MRVAPRFEKWAKGYSGCDGGNLKGSIWLCGIEWSIGVRHVLREELARPVARVPQRYMRAEDVLWSPEGRSHPFNQMFLKLMSALRGHDVQQYRSLLDGDPFPFHKKSDFFKMNLFPIAFPRDEDELWTDEHTAATGLASKPAYRAWCREYRFPRIRSWVRRARPRLVIAVGLGRQEEFQMAFDLQGPQQDEWIEGARLRWVSDGTTTLAVVPFPHSSSGLNSNVRVQAFGQRLGELYER